MKKIVFTLLFILSIFAKYENLLPNDFQVSYRANIISAFNTFLKQLKDECKQKEVKTECNNYFPRLEIEKMLVAYQHSKPTASDYKNYYDLKKQIHNYLYKLSQNAHKIIDKNRKKAKQRSPQEIAITYLSGQCEYLAMRFKDQDNVIQIAEEKLQQVQKMEQDDKLNRQQKDLNSTKKFKRNNGKRKIEKIQQAVIEKQKKQREEIKKNKIETSEESRVKVNNDEPVKVVKRRKIFLFEILNCKNCLEKRHVKLF